MFGRYPRNIVARCAVQRSLTLITPRFLFPTQRFCPLKSRGPDPPSPSILLAKYPRSDLASSPTIPARHTAASIYNRLLLSSRPSPWSGGEGNERSRTRIIKPSWSRVATIARKRGRRRFVLRSRRNRDFKVLGIRTVVAHSRAKSTRVDPRRAVKSGHEYINNTGRHDGTR